MNQPRPKKQDGPPCWLFVHDDLVARGETEVISDCGVRNQMGIQKYGTALQPFDGRNSALDAYEEAMDLVVYLKKLLMEQPPLVPPSEDFRHLSRLYHQAIGIMCALKDYQIRQEAIRAAFEEARKQHEGHWAFQKKVVVEPVSGPIYPERYPASKPQEVPVVSVPTVWASDPSESHQAHTGHPEAFQGMLGVEVANQQPAIFIPPQIRGQLREDMEAWKANMEASMEAERAKFLKNQESMAQELTRKPSRGDGKLHTEYGEFS